MTTTGLLDRAVAAAGERAGRDLKQWRSATDLTHLAASKVKGTLDATGADGGTLLADVPILKAGTFHGGYVVIDEASLAAMVARFSQLAPDVFVPPVRIDHSWNVLNVIGHIAALRVEIRADASNGGVETAFLLADLQILDDQALDLIKRGILRNRSSEIGPYEANTGQVFSDVMWGVAFVDIPAVEGLGNVPLSKLGRETPGLGRPHTITELTEGGHVADDDKGTEQTAEQGEQQEGSAAADTGSEQGHGDGDAQQDQADAGTAGSGDQDADGGQDGDQGQEQDGAQHDAQDAADATQAGGGDASPGDQGPGNASDAALAAQRATLGLRGDESPEQVLRALGLTKQADELAKADRDAVEAAVLAYGKKGVLGAAAHEPTRALLGHKDPTVRAYARSLLDNLASPVELGKSAGKQSSTKDATGPRGDDAAVTAEDFARAEDLDELSELYEAMPRADRRDRNSALSKAFAARRAELAAS